MKNSFENTLRRLRKEKNLSQQQLADILFVKRSSIANWETGRRIPDAVLIVRIAKCLDVDVNTLFEAIDNTVEEPNIIIVDNDKTALKESLSLIEEQIPNALFTGFTSAEEALQFSRSNRIHLAFSETELEKTNGLDLCRELLKINPRTNVIFLTSSPAYALDAWDTGACGFAVKPLSVEQLHDMLSLMRFPVKGLLV